MTLYLGSVEQMVTQDVQLRGDTSFLDSVTKDILRALTYLANKGLIHRDVKPDNILVESILVEEPKDNSTVKYKYVLADFGLSKVSFHRAVLLAIVTDIENARSN